MWADEHSWLLASKLDFDSTPIAGTRELIRELEYATGKEGLPIHPDVDPWSRSDVDNCPEYITARVASGTPVRCRNEISPGQGPREISLILDALRTGNQQWLVPAMDASP